MARRTKVKEPKELIYVFCEGESEIQYIEYMKNEFTKVSILKPRKGMIPEAEKKFKNDPKLRDSLSETNEIWFFFDVESYDRDHWDDWAKSVKNLSRSNKKLKVRFLMTTACIEYWFLLHYDQTAPSIQNQSDKEHVISRLREHVSHYKKADRDTIWEIAANYTTAIKNGEWTLDNIQRVQPIPNNSTQERDAWLFHCDHTFTTVHEAISHLKELS